MDSATEKIVGLGSAHLETSEENGSRFIVMQDPDGNEFCLVRFTPGWMGTPMPSPMKVFSKRESIYEG